MKDGFVKVAAATCKIKVADCEYNADNIIKAMKETSASGAKLTVFPELSLTGYTCSDLFFQSAMQSAACEQLRRIVNESRALETIFAVGAPLVHGNRLYNCTVMIYGGDILGVVPKSFIPNYNEFYEARHFAPAPKENGEISLFGKKYPFGTKILFRCSSLRSFVIAAEICEDLWTAQPPSISHAAAGATVIINQSASDEVIGKDAYRRALVSGQSARLICGYVYCDAGDGESTTDMVFAGHNLICENGSVLSESKLFENTIIYSEFDTDRLLGERMKMNTYPSCGGEGYEEITFDMRPVDTVLTRAVAPAPFVPADEDNRRERCSAILTMQANGLKKRIEHTGAKKLVIGISGGLDSCLALIVCVHALRMLSRPTSDILAVTMPCFGTTTRTKSNAEKLCEYLGTDFKCIDIQRTVRCHFNDIGHDESDMSVVYENGQARERTKILMDLANKEGGMVIGTGDLSELALGWATYNGDHMSMYGVNSSIPKTLVRHLVRYEADFCGNDDIKAVLCDILDTPVSPELLPADNDNISQKTEDLVGPYELHDFFLYYAVRMGFAPSKIYRLCVYALGDRYADDTIKYWMKNFYRRFFSQQFKRSCLPDGPKVGTLTLSPRSDWRMPSDAAAKLWMNEVESL